MPIRDGEQQRQASGVMLRGGLILLIAILAMVRPDTFFLDGLIGVSAVCLVFGVHEANISIRLYRLESAQWWLPLLNAMTVFAFGATTFSLLFVPFDIAVAIIGAWFVCYALSLGIFASALSATRVAQYVLVALGLVHAAMAGLAVVAPVYPRLSILALPAVGAVYAALFGVWQIVIASWTLRQNSRALNSRAKAVVNDAQYYTPVRASGMP